MRILVPLVLITSPAWSAGIGRHFEGLEGSFVLLDAHTGRYTRYNPRRAAERFAPCSTYKVPNSAIALETGVVSGIDFTLKYDPQRDPAQPGWNPEWTHDHDLRSAFRNSVLWYYQEVARRIGRERMEHYIRQFGYGNQDVSGPIDTFWLGNTLAISANEQVEFVRRLREGRLGLSARTTGIVKEIFLYETGPGWRWSAKTGSCRVSQTGEDRVGWLVGYVEKGDRVYYYALNIASRDPAVIANRRIPIARAILSDLGVLR